MPPPRQGSVEPLKRANGVTYYRARIRHADGFRERVDVPEKYSTPAGGLTARERAEQWAAALQEDEADTHTLYESRRATLAEAANVAAAGTLDTFAAGVFARRQGEGKSSVGRERRMWKARVSGRLGALSVANVTKEQIEDFRDYLDTEVRARIKDGKDSGVSGKTAMIIWTLVRTVFKEAVNCRDRSKRVRSDDPTLGVLPPLKTRSRKKTFIFPGEFETLLACAIVPLDWRVLYAIAAYLYVRPGELRALTWAQVDVESGVVSVINAYDEEADEAKPTKTERGQREVSIPPALAPLLQAMKAKASPGDLVVALLLAIVADNRRAALFREHLKLAGLERARLLEDTATTMKVNFRSLRDSGITWEALAGTSIDRIQARAGHEHIATTLGYVKAVEDLKGKFGTPFGPLPIALLGGTIGPRFGPSAPAMAKSSTIPKAEGLRLLDSKRRGELHRGPIKWLWNAFWRTGNRPGSRPFETSRNRSTPGPGRLGARNSKRR